MQTDKNKKPRGFAAMSSDKQREIASMGGRAGHEKGTAHEWTKEDAREAGRRGGKASQANRWLKKLSESSSSGV